MYYFRAKVPVDLSQHYAPKREITFSLRTRDPREALERVRLESVKLDQEFAAARRLRDAELQTLLSDTEIERIIAIFMHEELDQDENQRLGLTGDDEVYEAVRNQMIEQGLPVSPAEGRSPGSMGISERLHQKMGETLEFGHEYFRWALSRGNISAIEDEMDLLMEAHGLRLDPTSDAYRKLGHALLKAFVQINDMKLARHSGDVVHTPPAPPVALASLNVPDDDLTLSKLWERYKTERQLPPKTESDFWTYVRRFVEVNGDLALKSITKAHVRVFKDAMLKLPVRPNKLMQTLTVPEIIELLDGKDDVPRLSTRTINDKALGAISAVLSYGVENGYLEDNPAKGIKAVGPKDLKPARVPYSIEDLKVIFSSAVFSAGARPRGGAGEAAKWLPLLAAFTGARLEELGRLEVSDIGTEEEVPHLFIQTRGEGRGLKNRHSRRKVPLHPELIRLGFLDYVDDCRKTSNVALFPDLKSNRTEVTAAFSKWWGRYSRSLGIDEPQKVFHSFRHLVKRSLRDAGVDKTLRDALQGHAVADVAESYGVDAEGFGVSLPVLYDSISKLSYPGLDLSHLYPVRTQEASAVASTGIPVCVP